MKSKTIILDNFFEEPLVLEVLYQLKTDNIPETWFHKEQSHTYNKFCKVLLEECKKYYDLSNYIGYEFWTQNNTKPADWHVDKDEKAYEYTQQFILPICTIVYYPKVDNLLGGILHLEDCSITPKTNRVVIFPPGIWHKVDDFSGERVSILVNPWVHKPDGY
jgi:hypothetical protein